MTTLRSPRIGSTVSLRGTTKLGKIVKVSRWHRRPGMWPVQFGDEHWRNIDARHLQVVGLIRSKEST